jgi:hypothetical protein
VLPPQQSGQETNASQDASQSSPAAALPYAAERTIGTGTSAIYLYYFSTYRTHSATNQGTRWPCKIGRSDRDPMLRVLSQAATALPELPTVALLIRTDDPSALEAALHAILTLRGRRSVQAPGTEWFDTTPDEVMQILRFIQPSIYGGAEQKT